MGDDLTKNNAALGEGAAEGYREDHAKIKSIIESCHTDSISSTPKTWGATREEWAHLDIMLGLTADLLPVISNPNARISPDSKMKEKGKTPSQYNRNRMVAGFSSWTSYEAKGPDIERWSAEPDYGICIQTRFVRGIDVDCTDAHVAERIRNRIIEVLGFCPPVRRRSNSSKFLMPVCVAGEFGKRKVGVVGGAIELLANGQQFIAVGTHPSGVAYDWEGGLPDEIPEIDMRTLEGLWDALVAEFATDEPTESRASKAVVRQPGELADPVAEFMDTNGWVHDVAADGRVYIRCPFEDEHTSESNGTDTTYFTRGTGGYDQGHFKCLHGHCTGRSDTEFLHGIGYFEAAIPDLSADVAAELVEKRKRFEVIPAHVFAEGKPPSWIVKGLLPRAELAVVFGPSGAGKSFFVLDLVAAVARGVEWHGRKVKQGRVIYVAAEGAGGIRNRLKAYSMHHNLNLSDIPIGIIDAAPDLTGSDIIPLIHSIEKADVIVIDTLAQTTAGADENSGKDMGRVLANCKQLHAATGATVVLVHHAGKDTSKGARGWSGLRAAVDTEIEISSLGMIRTARISKQKDGDDSAVFNFKLQQMVVGLDEDDDEISSCAVVFSDPPLEKVKTPQGKHEKLVYEEVMHQLGAGSMTVNIDALINKLKDNLPRGSAKKDRRAETIKRAIHEVQAAGYFHISGGVISMPLRRTIDLDK